MDKRITEYIARRMEGPNLTDDDRNAEIEYRRRHKLDGTFATSEHEFRPEHEGIIRGTGMTHHGPDSEQRRRIGFAEGYEHEKSHWNEEEFVANMEESLYHEVDDIFHYLKIMEKVYDKGYDGLASAFYDIANEKYVCAEFLKRHLKKIGMFDEAEHKRLEKDLKEVGRMFK